MLGYEDKQAMLNLHPAELSPEFQLDGRPSLEKCVEMDAIAREKGYHRFDWIHRRKNGSDIPVEVTLNPVKIGGMDALLVVWHDLSPRIDAERRIRESAERLQFALEASQTGLWDWLVDVDQVFYSDTWYTMLGYEPAELPMTFKTWEGLVHPQDQPLARQAIQDHFSGKTSRYVCEVRMRNKAGQWQWVQTIGEVAERCPDGEVKRMVGLHVDIHPQKLAQATIEQARDLAEQASRSKSAFVANMSHEIRTPMNAILGYADLLLDADQTEADKRNHAQTIRRNGKHLLGILNDVLDISKIEAGKMSIERIACTSDQLFTDVITLMMPKAAEKGIQLNVEASNPLPPRVMTDPTRVRQVMINLIGNAIKFTNEGSVRLSIRSELIDNGRIQLTCDVKDTGIGIEPEQLDRLFKPFNQADESTTRKFGGTGLGLAISQNLCTMLGGDLSCTSTRGEGSTFTARFVVGQAAPDRSEKPKRKQNTEGVTKPLQGKRILVVEDAKDNQRLIRHYLVKAGADVEIAENGATGRDAALKAQAEDKPFSIVLMDMQMPVLDGYSATRELRSAGYNLFIIALTAHASEADRQECLDAGCNDYLTKPIDRTNLVSRLCDHLANGMYEGIGI